MIGRLRPCSKVCHGSIGPYAQVYCDTCSNLSHEFGFVSRAAVVNDVVTLRWLSHPDTVPLAESRNCLPWRRAKDTTLTGRLTAALSVLATEQKILDDLRDAPSPLMGAMRNRLRPVFTKARELLVSHSFPLVEFDQIASDQVSQESRSPSSLLAATEPSARAYSLVARFVAKHQRAEDEAAAAAVGAWCGRWVYLTDALQDIDADRQTGNYNPFSEAGHVPPPQQLRSFLHDMSSSVQQALRKTSSRLRQRGEALLALLEAEAHWRDKLNCCCCGPCCNTIAIWIGRVCCCGCCCSQCCGDDEDKKGSKS